MTKLPQVEIKPAQKLDKEVRLKHDKENKKQKDYLDKRKKVKDKEVQQGDSVLLKKDKRDKDRVCP